MNTHCEFENKASSLFVCKKCGRAAKFEFSSPDDRTFVCLKEPSGVDAPAAPPLARRLANFTVAAIGHFVAGCPTCTQEQIDERLAVCRQCPYFSDDLCTHAKCGCHVNEGRFLNKLAWADQACPIGKWGAIA